MVPLFKGPSHQGEPLFRGHLHVLVTYFAILHVNVPLMRGHLLCRDKFYVTRCPLIRGFTILILETVVMTTTSVIYQYSPSINIRNMLSVSVNINVTCKSNVHSSFNGIHSNHSI